MGWLFAVALGLQEGSGRTVWRGLPPLMLGHALAVAAAVLAIVVDTLGYLLVTGCVAAVIYYRLGLSLLQRAWVNSARTPRWGRELAALPAAPVRLRRSARPAGAGRLADGGR
jgi:hypothetical protein